MIFLKSNISPFEFAGVFCCTVHGYVLHYIIVFSNNVLTFHLSTTSMKILATSIKDDVFCLLAAAS